MQYTIEKSVKSYDALSLKPGIIYSVYYEDANHYYLSLGNYAGVHLSLDLEKKCVNFNTCS